MTCLGCVGSVRRIAQTVRGVEVHDCTVGSLEFSATEASEAEVKLALAQAGFAVQNAQQT
jgi:copper chaperone CopZ